VDVTTADVVLGAIRRGVHPGDRPASLRPAESIREKEHRQAERIRSGTSLREQVSSTRSWPRGHSVLT